MRVETLGKEALINCAKTAMSSKIVGAESEFFSQLVVDAVTSVKTEPRGEVCPQCSLRVTLLSLHLLVHFVVHVFFRDTTQLDIQQDMSWVSMPIAELGA